MSLTDRFWAKVDKSGDCWVWTAALLPTGYGEIGVAGKRSARAHRVAWELTNGPIPDGLWVLHRCDNRKCVRPEHLFLGTRQDNIDDAVAKGRAVQPVRYGDDHWTHRRPEIRTRGARNGAARVTADDVRTMRQDREAGVKLAPLAARYGISETAVSLICRRINWSHV